MPGLLNRRTVCGGLAATLGFFALGMGLHWFMVRRTKSMISKLRQLLKRRYTIDGEESVVHLIQNEVYPLSGLITGKVISIDCEWVKNGKVALLQVADTRGTCELVRLCKLDKVPDAVVNILNDKSIIKVGVNIHADICRLKNDYGVSTSSWVDIRHLAKRFRPDLTKLGLASLAKEFLNVTIDKDWKIAASNWEAKKLVPRQIEYSANDVLVGVGAVMAIALEHLEQSLTARELTYSDVIETAYNLCLPYRDTRFNYKGPKGPSTKSNNNHQQEKQNTKRQMHSTRKRPLYNNAKLEAPDGQQLCVCDAAKADWYVFKGLGEYVCRDPVTVRLNFEPAGRPEGRAGEYYLTEKTNNCVVCGKEDSYLRKYIVPHEYRKHFPGKSYLDTFDRLLMLETFKT